MQRRICAVRRSARFGPHRIPWALGLARSTVCTPDPTDRRRTARPSASSRSCRTSGPTPAHTAPTRNGCTNSRAGSTATITADRTAMSAGLSPPHTCKQRPWELQLVALDDAAGDAVAGPGGLPMAVGVGVDDDCGAVVVEQGVVGALVQGDGVAEVVGAGAPSAPPWMCGRSPACAPSSCRKPWPALPGLKWSPAAAKSGVQAPTAWMWKPCAPGESPLTSAETSTPLGPCVIVTVPIGAPSPPVGRRGRRAYAFGLRIAAGKPPAPVPRTVPLQ